MAQVLLAQPEQHNIREAAEQDYRLAKQNLDHILRLDWRERSNSQGTFRAAVERRDAARERFVALLVA